MIGNRQTMELLGSGLFVRMFFSGDTSPNIGIARFPKKIYRALARPEAYLTVDASKQNNFLRPFDR